MNIHRAHESIRHADGKIELGWLLTQHRFYVLYEHKLADVVAFRATGRRMRILCGEHELTRRNVCRNVRRNFGNGCTAMIMLVPDEPARVATRRFLQFVFPRRLWSRISILTHAGCRQQLVKLAHDSETITSVTVVERPAAADGVKTIAA
ncbi:MAG: hypothetical protein NTZ16_14300 [Verrucomicrobia bacterium]|nr:hypothetical protein [Verrucomicrobiota bacterium]